MDNVEAMLSGLLGSAQGADEHAEELDGAAENHRTEAKLLRRVVRLARIGQRVDRSYPGDLEHASLLVVGPDTTEHVKRLAEKAGLTTSQVFKAALRHLEWKVDREAEGLFIFAGEPAGEGDEVIPEDRDEPWKS